MPWLRVRLSGVKPHYRLWRRSLVLAELLSLVLLALVQFTSRQAASPGTHRDTYRATPSASPSSSLRPTTYGLPSATPSLTATLPPISALPGDTFRVVRVVDGDTVVLDDGQKVRYVGMDTPESVDPRKPVQCYGHEAAAENQCLVAGKEVRLVRDVSETDKYGRLLRLVYVGDLLVNDYLVRQGFAHTLTIPPDVAYAAQFRQAEAEARAAGRGLWSAC